MSKSEKANKAEVKRTHFRNGRVYQEVPFVRGKINGVVREYHKNGILAKEVPTKDGLRHGVCKQWNNKGELLGTFEMSLGTGISKQWFQNGHIQFEASIVNETFTGRLRRWNEKGDLVEERFFFHNEKLSYDEYDRLCQQNPALPTYSGETASRGEPLKKNGHHERYERLMARLLSTPKTEAREWLRTGGSGSKKTLGEFNAKKSVSVVTGLYDAGAVEVLAVDIDEDLKGNQHTHKLVASLPADIREREAIRNWCARQHFVFSPEKDSGQPHLAIFLG